MTQRISLRRVEPERLLHQPGEALLRGDFTDQAAQDDQLRWWHNRALHGAWGTADGLRVAGVTPGGLVRLSAGLAYDLFGRELILDQALRIPVPETGDEYLLVIAYDIPVTGCVPPNGLCLDRFVAASGVRAGWVLRRAFTPADGVPLAILNEDDTCQPRFVRPYLQSRTRPKIGTGSITISSRDFSPWRLDPGDEASPHLGWTYRVGTRAAGFNRAPHYFAEVAVPVREPAPNLAYAVARFHLAASAPDHFSIRYFSLVRNRFIGGYSPIFNGAGGDSPRQFTKRLSGSPQGQDYEIAIPLRITWIGIEPQPIRSRRDDLRSEFEVDNEFHS